MKKRYIALALTIILAFTALGFKGCGNSDLSTRAVRAVAAVPSVVRILFPDVDQKKLALIEAAVQAFNTFVNDRTSGNWQKAMNAWNNSARPVLLGFNNQRLNQIVAVTDIILSQVFIPEAVSDGPVQVEVRFSEEKVKELEKLVAR
jgi:hypothetical protein